MKKKTRSAVTVVHLCLVVAAFGVFVRVASAAPNLTCFWNEAYWGEGFCTTKCEEENPERPWAVCQSNGQFGECMEACPPASE